MGDAESERLAFPSELLPGENNPSLDRSYRKLYALPSRILSTRVLNYSSAIHQTYAVLR